MLMHAMCVHTDLAALISCDRLEKKVTYIDSFFYHTSHLYHVCLIDGVASVTYFLNYILLHGDARSRNFLMSGSIFILPPYAERVKK